MSLYDRQEFVRLKVKVQRMDKELKELKALVTQLQQSKVSSQQGVYILNDVNQPKNYNF